MGKLLYGVLWRLANGAECLIFRNRRDGVWTVEVRRDGDVLAAQDLSDIHRALDLSSRWRTTFSGELFDLL